MIKWIALIIFYWSLMVLTDGTPTIRPTISPTTVDKLPSPFWPQPSTFELTGPGSELYLNAGFNFITTFTNEILSAAIIRYEMLFAVPTTASGSITHCTIDIYGSSENSTRESLDLGMDESYLLKLSAQSCAIEASTVWGALHAIETFSQLLVRDAQHVPFCEYASVYVNDSPRFTHRGVMIDTARHYLPIDTIRSMVDILPMSKFNTLHIHLVDAEAFPFNSLSSPRIIEGAYSPESTYSKDDLNELTQYASDRGVRIVYEIDVPGHAASWNDGYPELMADCLQKYYYNINDFALNPSLEEVYTVLRGILSDIRYATNSKYLHIGGDEVVYGCWANDASIITFMSENGIADYDALMEYFCQKAESIVESLGATPVHWEEVFKAGVAVTKNTIFQVWTDQSLVETIVRAGHRVVASPSNQWYLDHTDNTWQKMYVYDPALNLTDTEAKTYLLGGEAVMFGEHVDENNIQSVIFPRAAAVGERLWSPSYVTDTGDAANRLDEHRCRMSARGFSVGPLRPGFCSKVYV